MIMQWQQRSPHRHNSSIAAVAQSINILIAESFLCYLDVKKKCSSPRSRFSYKFFRINQSIISPISFKCNSNTTVVYRLVARLSGFYGAFQNKMLFSFLMWFFTIIYFLLLCSTTIIYDLLEFEVESKKKYN